MNVEHAFKLVSNNVFIEFEKISKMINDFKNALPTFTGPSGLEIINVNVDSKSYCKNSSIGLKLNN